MLKELNPLLHSQLRLSIMSLLLTVGQAERSRICFSRKKFCRKETAYALSDYIGRAGSDG